MSGRLAGVALHLSALALFVVMDTLVKRLTAHYAVPQLCGRGSCSACWAPRWSSG